MNNQSSILASYACHADKARARLYPEPESPTRTAFQRDRDRIIHCATFRRLKHKTQVFVYHEGDYYRTRLTHSIEVAQIARSICRYLGLDDDLAEALALAHDFGHTPFGHAGEEALNAAMEHYGGFDHNAQSLRLVTRLEERYASFRGLNLTWDTLEGLAKHNGPLVSQAINTQKPPQSLPYGIAEYLQEHDLEIHTYASAEAQVAAASDDIAYNNHDIEDGLRAGLFTLDQMMAVPFVDAVIDEVRGLYPKIEQNILVHEVVRRLINIMITDLMTESTRRIKDLNPQTVDDIRQADRSVISFSAEMKEKDRQLKSFLFKHMYEHESVLASTGHGKKVVTKLFNHYMQDQRQLPPQWLNKTENVDEIMTARVVSDFIAGMTDRFALQAYDAL